MASQVAAFPPEVHWFRRELVSLFAGVAQAQAMEDALPWPQAVPGWPPAEAVLQLVAELLLAAKLLAEWPHVVGSAARLPEGYARVVVPVWRFAMADFVKPPSPASAEPVSVANWPEPVPASP